MIDVSKRNPIAHTTFKKEFFNIKARYTHMFKDASFTVFLSPHLIPMDLLVLRAHQPAHELKCGVCRCELAICVKVELKHCTRPFGILDNAAH